MFKVAGYPSCNILNTLTLKLILDDLENNREKAESNPSKLVILRTFNPKLYEMRLNLFDNIYPNLHSYKYDLDNYVTESIERFKDDTELQNIIKKILGDKIVNLENDILQDKHAKLYTFNLKQLKKLRDKSVKSCLFVENLLNQIKIIYKKNISDEYQNILTKIIRNYYNK